MRRFSGRNMELVPRALWIASLLGGSMQGQSLAVVPSAYASLEADSRANWPFGLSGSCRVLYIYESATVPVGVAAISAIALRADGGTNDPAKAAVDLLIRLSTTQVSVWKADPVFNNNHGGNVVVGVSRRIVSLPAQSNQPTPGAYLTHFLLDAPFSYVRDHGNLVIDYVVYAQSQGTREFDSSYLFPASHTQIGSSCAGMHQVPTGGAATNSLASLNYALSSGPPGGQAVHVLGTALFQPPLILPFGGCPLYQDIVLTVNQPIDATGQARVRYPLLYIHKGAHLFGQFIAVDSALTTLRSTQCHETVIGGFDPQTRVADTTTANSTSGIVQVGVGIVTRLTY